MCRYEAGQLLQTCRPGSLAQSQAWTWGGHGGGASFIYTCFTEKAGSQDKKMASNIIEPYPTASTKPWCHPWGYQSDNPMPRKISTVFPGKNSRGSALHEAIRKPQQRQAMHRVQTWRGVDGLSYPVLGRFQEWHLQLRVGSIWLNNQNMFGEWYGLVCSMIWEYLALAQDIMNTGI